MAGQVIFAELHVHSGERQESSDLVGVATSPALSLFKRRRGQLFTIAEPSLPEDGGLCRRLIQTVENQYFHDSSRSVTSSLRDALAAANELLRAENSNAEPDRQLRVGICCAVVRERDVFVAQVAPANAFILHDGSVKRVLSAYSVVPDATTNGTTRASDSLGTRLEPQVNFGYSPFEEGDLVVMATGSYWKMIPDRYIQDAGRHVDPDTAASELYNNVLSHARRPTTSIVVIRLSELPLRQRSNGNGKGNGHGAAAEELPAVPEKTAPQAEKGPGNGHPRSWTPISRVPGETEARPLDEITPPRRRVPGVVAPGRSSGAEGAPSPKTAEQPARRTFWSRIALWHRRKKVDLYPPGPALAPVGKPSVKLKGHLPQPRSQRSRPSTLVNTVALMVALAAVFVAVGFVGIGFLRSWQLGDPVAFARDAREKQAQAASAAEETTARALLAESAALFARSLKAKEDGSVRTAADAVQEQIDRIDRAVRIGKADTVVDLSTIAEEKSDVTRLVVDGNSLYLLDEGLDRVYRYTLTSDGRRVEETGQPPALVKRGEKVDGTPTGDLLSMAWMPAGRLREAPSLFLLDGGQSVVSFDPKIGLSRVEVGESKHWGSIQAMAGFGGVLYLLDTKQRTICYYPPTKGGYESEPYTIVDASTGREELSKAVDIALDGNLYLLEGDGTVKRFTREGKPLEFSGQLPDGKIKGPRALYASANTRSLYVLDRAEERIVQFSPEGKLQRQFRGDGKVVSFRDSRSIFVDEVERRAYLLARKSLLVFDLPPMQ